MVDDPTEGVTIQDYNSKSAKDKSKQERGAMGQVRHDKKEIDYEGEINWKLTPTLNQWT